MNKYKFILIAFFALTNLFCFAQAIYKDYDWEQDAKLINVPIKHKNAPQVILKESTIVEFDYGQKNDLLEYYIYHTITHVNSDDAIEENNKVYLPVRANVDVLKQKARVINPSGKVIEMQESDIKEAKQENGIYRYFALRGLEKGSQVESFFVLRKKRPEFEGKIIVMQDNIPKYNTTFDIYSPNNLLFTSKSYNGLKELDLKLSDKENDIDFNHLSNKWDFIEALKAEDNAYYLPNVKKLIYKIDRNIMKPKVEIISYDKIAKSFYEGIDVTPEKKLGKKLKKYLKTSDVLKQKDLEQKLFALENFLKINHPVVPGYASELEDIEGILKNKAASKRGIVKLYCAFLNYLKIEHQLVLTNNRNTHKFDKDFEAYNFLENYMIYFPALKKYMAPTEPLTKLGIVPQLWTNNYGLFIEPIKVGNFKTANPKIAYIKPLTFKDSRDDMFVDVFTEDGFKSLSVKYKEVLTGHYAQGRQPIYDFLDEKSKEEYNESQIKFLTEDLNIETFEVENGSLKDFGMKPFSFTSDFTTKAFIERAGDKILFQIGKLIGPQVEMYQEEKRKLPVENAFNRHYHRELSLTVPAGFELGNLDALNFNEVYKENGKIEAQFVSNYTFENNVVKVIVDEYYDKIEWSVKLFDEYRRVINAAADFNKVVLYLEKK